MVVGYRNLILMKLDSLMYADGIILIAANSRKTQEMNIERKM